MGESYLKNDEYYEARAWLKDNQHPAPVGSNRFWNKESAVEFVEQLYAAGAKAVYALHPRNESIGEECGAYTDTLVVVLPSDKAKRKKLFEIARNEAEQAGYDGEMDTGQDELLFWWD